MEYSPLISSPIIYFFYISHYYIGLSNSKSFQDCLNEVGALCLQPTLDNFQTCSTGRTFLLGTTFSIFSFAFMALTAASSSTSTSTSTSTGTAKPKL